MEGSNPAAVDEGKKKKQLRTTLVMGQEEGVLTQEEVQCSEGRGGNPTVLQRERAFLGGKDRKKSFPRGGTYRLQRRKKGTGSNWRRKFAEIKGGEGTISSAKKEMEKKGASGYKRVAKLYACGRRKEKKTSERSLINAAPTLEAKIAFGQNRNQTQVREEETSASEGILSIWDRGESQSGHH